MSQNQAVQIVQQTAGGVGFQTADPKGNVQVVARTQNKQLVPAGQTKAVLGAVGAAGDTLSLLIIIPATTSPGAVTLFDGSGSAGIILFAGGATSVGDLKPIPLRLDSQAITAANPGWYVTTGANVSVAAFGNFT
jgi:hypothetical protein